MEQYLLNWPGRADALRRSREPTDRVLRPRCRESLLFDQARNVVIQEESLTALALLQESLLERVTLVSLALPAPPPGSGDQGQNHSAWLSVACPLFRLAWNLLHHRGVLQVALPAGEEVPLLFLLDELFGEEQRLFSWSEGAGPGRTVHYCKNALAGTTPDSPWQEREGCLLVLADPAAPRKAVAQVDRMLAHNSQDQGERSLLLILPPGDGETLEHLRGREMPFRLLRGDTATLEEPLAQPPDDLQQDLPLQIERIKPGRTAEDLLFHALLSRGIPPGVPLERQPLAGDTLFWADRNRLAAWFGHTLEDLVPDEIARRRPGAAIFRESAFTGEEHKRALEHRFRQSSPGTVVGWL